MGFVEPSIAVLRGDKSPYPRLKHLQNGRHIIYNKRTEIDCAGTLYK